MVVAGDFNLNPMDKPMWAPGGFFALPHKPDFKPKDIDNNTYLPYINPCWRCFETETSYLWESRKGLDGLKRNLLDQVIYRGDPDLVSYIQWKSQIGQSDHSSLVFSINT